MNFLGSVSFEEKIFFTRHLSVMIKSGIPIDESLRSLETETTNVFFRTVIHAVGASVSNGSSFYVALSLYPKVFDGFYRHMVKVGEESGTLEKNLEYLASQLKKDAEFRKKIVSASLYPSIVVMTAVVVGGGVSIFVLPRLIDLFSSLDVKLPVSTQILLWFAGVMQHYGILIGIAVGVMIVLMRALISISKIRIVWQRFLLHLPAVGRFVRDVEMSQMCRNFGVMLSSGLPIADALHTLSETTTNLVFQGYIQTLVTEIEKGKSIESIVGQKKKFYFFPAIAARMIAVGEKTGKLDESLLYLGDFFEEEVDNSAKNLTAVLEPVLLLVVGLIVAFMAMAIISPIYQFTGSIKR